MLFIGGALKRFDPELVACMQIRCRAPFIFFSKVLFLKIKTQISQHKETVGSRGFTNIVAIFQVQSFIFNKSIEIQSTSFFVSQEAMQKDGPETAKGFIDSVVNHESVYAQALYWYVLYCDKVRQRVLTYQYVRMKINFRFSFRKGRRETPEMFGLLSL